MKKIHIIQTGSTFPDVIEKFGDFDEMITDIVGECVVVDAVNGTLPDFDDCAGVIITGSHDMVTEMPEWCIKLAGWLAEAVKAEVPILGICYGHQLLAHALGGEVGYHPNGIEIGTSDISLTDESENDILFYDLDKGFPAHVIHSQTVLELPKGAVHLAENSYEPNHAFRYGSCAWGVQFHPEFTADIMRNYISRDAGKYLSMDRDVSATLELVKDTEISTSVLRKFAVYCR